MFPVRLKVSRFVKVRGQGSNSTKYSDLPCFAEFYKRFGQDLPPHCGRWQTTKIQNPDIKRQQFKIGSRLEQDFYFSATSPCRYTHNPLAFQMDFVCHCISEFNPALTTPASNSQVQASDQVGVPEQDRRSTWKNEKIIPAFRQLANLILDRSMQPNSDKPDLRMFKRIRHLWKIATFARNVHECLNTMPRDELRDTTIAEFKKIELDAYEQLDKFRSPSFTSHFSHQKILGEFLPDILGAMDNLKIQNGITDTTQYREMITICNFEGKKISDALANRLVEFEGNKASGDIAAAQQVLVTSGQTVPISYCALHEIELSSQGFKAFSGDLRDPLVRRNYERYSLSESGNYYDNARLHGDNNMKSNSSQKGMSTLERSHKLQLENFYYPAYDEHLAQNTAKTEFNEPDIA
ncbi:hypothetical protein HRG_012888 [Hirsutella rhossiliensis]